MLGFKNKVNMKSKYGMCFGILALCLSVGGMSAFLNYNPDDWFVLDWLAPTNSESNVGLEFSAGPPELFEITEKNAIRWMFIISVVFSVFAFGLAIFGELKKESTLFTAASVFFGFGAISVLNVWAGLAVLFISSCAVFYIRSKRELNPNNAN